MVALRLLFLKELKGLVDEHKIVIMSADKGGAVVIMDAMHYRQMIHKVFNNPDYFEPCDGNQTKEIMLEIASFCRKYQNNLTKDEINFISKFDAKESNFYGLPKVHKSVIIKEAIQAQKSEVIKVPSPSDLKIRPIIGGTSSPTSRLSQFVDHLLQPFMTRLPSYVRDSVDILNMEQEWETDANEEYTLLAMDISDMFMNVSESLGRKAISHFLTEYPEYLHPRFNVEFVTEAVLIIIKNNVSFFDGEFRRQTHGCAMGSHKSPTYSSIAVGYLENELYSKLHNTEGEQYANYVRQMLKRFLDDIFMKWKNSLGDPMNLLREMNSLDPKIIFTLEIGQSVPFLDIRFEIRSDNSLDTDIYYKPTDSHNFVPFFSFHPRKTLSNIPFTLARRICTIVSDKDKRDIRLAELRVFLRRKSYPDGLISNGIERACAIERSTLLANKENSSQETIPFVHTNNCSNPQVLDIIRHSTHMLAPSERMQNVLANKKIVAAKRQPPNLKLQLFKPRFDTRSSSAKGSVTACRNLPNRKPMRGQPCRCCNSLNECNSFKFFGSSEEFEIRWHFSCETMNVLYALTCPGCGHNYIGQTERAVRDRCGDYRRAISDPKFHTQGVHKHLATCGKGSFSMTPFFKLKDNNRGHNFILTYESHFIKRFKPSLNESKL